MSFDDLGLNKEFTASIQAAGYEDPTELQQQLIPCINEGESALVWTQSASGKTGSFLIPAINYVLSNPLEEHRGARVLVLTSRRDRVNQITYTIKRLLGEQQIRSGFIVSGRPYQPQMRLLRRPLDLMIATPGRLNDLVDNNKANFSGLEMLIIDDLTAIYKKGLHTLVEKIIKQRDKEYPIIAFVRHDEVVTPYSRELLGQAKEITIQDEKTQILQLKHVVHISDDFNHKAAITDNVLKAQGLQPTLIYTNNSQTAKSLADYLANHGHIVDAIHLLDEEERNTDACPILIVPDEEGIQPSTNGAERVIHFEMPDKVEGYISRMQHFMGGSNPHVFTLLVAHRERDHLRKLEEYLGESFEQKKIPGLEPSGRSNKNSKAKTNKPQKSNNFRQQNGRGGGSPGNHQRNHDSKRPPARHKSSGANAGASRSPGGNQQHRKKDGNNLRMRNTPMGNSNGNDAPYDIGGWEKQQDYGTAKPSSNKKVVIRYKEKRRTVINK